MKNTLKVSGQATDIVIGDRIKTIRKTLGLSQEKVAEHLGVTFQQMQKYEKGTNRVGVHALLEMCKLFGCNPMDILGVVWDHAEDDIVFSKVTAENIQLRAKIDAARKALA